MLSLTALLEATSSYHPKVVMFERDFPEFKNVEFISNNIKSFDSNILYFGYTSALSESLAFIKDAVLILVKNQDISYSTLSGNSLTIVEYPSKTDAFQLFNKINSINYSEWTYLSNSSLFFDQMIKSKNLNELVEAASNMLQNHVLVCDVSFKVLASSRSVKLKDELQRQIIENGGFSYEYILEINRYISSPGIPRDKTPYYVKTDMSPARRLVSKLFSKTTHIGYLVTLETSPFFNKIDMRLYERMSEIVAIAVGAYKNIQKKYSNIEAILTDLLDGHITDKTIHLQNIKELGLENSDCYQLICFQLTNYSYGNATDYHLKNTIAAIFPDSYSIYYKDNVIVLIKLSGSGFICESAKDTISKFCADNGLIAGISTSFSDLFSLPLYFRQASSALKLSSMLKMKGCFFDYENFKFFDLAVTASRSKNPLENNLKNYCSTKLLNVQRYDKDHSTDYMETLWAFLNNSQNLIKTANSLFIHKNTAAYRIQKLKEYFEIDMTDDYQLFRLYGSFLLLKCIE